MSDFDENRNWANTISEKLEHSDKESIIVYFNKLCTKWILCNEVIDSLTVKETPDSTTIEEGVESITEKV